MKFCTVIDDHQFELGDNSFYSFPNEKYNLSLELSPFWQVRFQILVDGDLLLVGPPMVIPFYAGKCFVGSSRCIKEQQKFVIQPGSPFIGPPAFSKGSPSLPQCHNK